MRKLLAFAIAALLVAPGLSRVGKAEVTVDVFYKGLEPHGEWIETSDYGYVFHPRDVQDDWRPYTVGNWAYTDAGWTWVSEEPFGWATYHYGRWAQTESVGWVWVPDTEWGPAWVSWRRSPKHVGWAPLPPEADFRREVGIRTWSDSYYDVGPSYYSFVEVRQFGAPRLSAVILPPRETVTVIRETRNITNITYVNNFVYNEGPEYDVIVRESAQPVRRLRLDRRTDIVVDGGNYRDDVFRTQVSGDSLRVAAPQIRYVENARPARVARRLERTEVKRGWDGINDKQQAQQLRAELNRDAAKVPEQLPKEAKFERLAQRAERRQQAGETQPANTAAPADGDATKPGRTAADRERMREGRDGQPAKPGEQPGATVGTPGEDRPARPNREGRQDGDRAPGRAGADGKMRDGTAPGAATSPGAEAPGAAAAPATTTPDATTPADADTKPGSRANREKAERQKDSERQGRDADRKNGEGAASAEAPKPGARATAAPGGDATTPPTGENAAGRMERPDARNRGADAATPDRDRPGRRAERGDGNKPADKPAAAADKPEAAKTERPDRPDRPETSAAAPQRPDRPDRPDRPQNADRPERAEKPDKAEKPDRPEKSERPERPDKAATPDRGPGAAARAGGGDRPGRPEGAGDGGGRERKGGGDGRKGEGGDRPAEANAPGR